MEHRIRRNASWPAALHGAGAPPGASLNFLLQLGFRDVIQELPGEDEGASGVQQKLQTREQCALRTRAWT